jgi:predicted Zn finger-like uncharacterized protein
MKFICDNCKAKYQIGDEKVAGKTVRMKCRRCGHLVQVSASVTESSVSQALPVEPPRPASDEPPRALHQDDDPTAVLVASAGNAGLADLVEAVAKAPAVAAKPAAVAAKPAAVAAKPAAVAAKPAAVAAKPAATGAPAPHAPRPPSDSLGLPQPPEGAPRPLGAPRPGVAGRPAAPPRPVDVPQPAREGAPLAGQPAGRPAPAAPVARAQQPVPAAAAVSAFKASVPEERPVAKAPVVRVTPSEDWYVGVGGVPLGPVRLSVIRDKALAGVVDGESLVWREGFEEWLPLKSFPELLEIVTQAQVTRLASPGRRVGASLSAAPISAVPISAQPISAQPISAQPGRSLTPASVVSPFAGPPAPAHVPSRELEPPEAVAAVPAPVAFAAAGGATRVSGDAVAPLDMLADPFAIRPAPVAPAPASAAATLILPTSPAAHVPGPAAHVPGSSPPAAPAPVLPAAEPAPLLATPASLVETVSPRRRSGMSPMAYAFIAMAAAFGGVSAFVLLSPKPQPVQIVTTPQVQAPAPIAAVPPPPSAEEAASALPIESASAKVEAAPPTKLGGALPPRPQPGASTTAAPLDMSGFSGAGVAGPRSGPGTSGESGALGQLSQGEISSVVEQNRPGVRRRCWQPAMDARASNAPTTARVSAVVVIGASGVVQSATASGSEKDYPGLSSCIAGRIKSWKFPASSGSTPVNIPFVFAAQ